MSFGPASTSDTAGLRIALYGGSFNPPHIAHQFAILYALATAQPAFDRLWIIPTFKHPFDKHLVPFVDRMTMCMELARPFGRRVEVSRIEEELDGESYTMRTVEALKARHPTTTFAWMIGADLIEEREKWNRWAELKDAVEFFIVGRSGYTHSLEDRPDMPGVSSTEIRARLAAGKDCAHWLDARVLAYINGRGLYRG